MYKGHYALVTLLCPGLAALMFLLVLKARSLTVPSSNQGWQPYNTILYSGLVACLTLLYPGLTALGTFWYQGLVTLGTFLGSGLTAPDTSGTQGWLP